MVHLPVRRVFLAWSSMARRASVWVFLRIVGRTLGRTSQNERDLAFFEVARETG